MTRLNEAGPPIFIVGCGRSGTTMLRLMLDRHPQLAIPWESHFIRPLLKDRHELERDGRVDAEEMTRRIMRAPQFQQWGLPEAEVWRGIRALDSPGFTDVIREVFRMYAASHGKHRWGDKTPIYVHILRELADLFPDARFMHVIRDGRDVALSYMAKPWGPENAWQAGRKWKRDVDAGREAGLKIGSRYREVRYESLVRDPRGEVEDICGFVDLPFHASMLEFGDEVLRKLPEEKRIHHASVGLLPTQGLRDWRTQMRPSDARAFEAVAGELLDSLGYGRRYESVPFQWRARRLLRLRLIELKASGSRVKRRIAKRLRTTSPTSNDAGRGVVSATAGSTTQGPSAEREA